MDTANLITQNILQSNDGSSSTQRVIDWSQIEIAPANEDAIEVPVAEEKLCLMLGISDKSGHRQTVAGAAIEASIANMDACVDDIDENLRESRLSVSVSKVPRTSEWLIDRPKVSVQTVIVMRYGDPIDLGIDRAGTVQPVYVPY
jgi:hypothetical protein